MPQHNKTQMNDLLKSFCVGLEKKNLDVDTLKWAVQTGLSSIALDYSNTNLINDISGCKNLTANNLTSQFWYQTQLNLTKQIISALNEQGIVPTLLKGISISTSYYPKPHYRTMRDIDILVDVREVDKVEEILSSLGYEQRSTYSKEFYESLHHTMPWQHCKEDIWIEVHKRLFPKTSPCYNSPVFQLDVVQNERLLDDFYGLKVYRLSKEFQIVYIATHWAERFKQIGGLFALLDIALIINKHNDELDWNKIISCSNSPHVSNYVYLTLQYLSKSGLLHSSVNIEQHVCRIKHTLGITSKAILNSIVNDYIFVGKPFGRALTVNNIAIIWRHLLEPSSSFVKVLLLPFVIIFPKGSNKKFDFKFQLSRIKSFLKFKR